MLPGKEHWLPAATAARVADTDIHYLHKLIKAGQLQALPLQTGKIKKWFVNPDCPRYQKLLNRNNPAIITENSSQQVANCPLDWNLWEDMCRTGEEIVRSRCSGKTIEEYRRYITNFFKDYPELSRDTLRAALQSYEKKMTRERDYYTARRMLHQAMMTVARFFVYKGLQSAEFVHSLEYLRPKPENTVVSRPCHNEGVIHKAVEVVGTAKNKKGVRAFRYYDEILNRALVQVAFYTGARSGEICGIRTKDIDYKNASLKLFGKGGKMRYVGICPELKAALRAYWSERPKTESDYFFVSDRGNPLRPSYISRRLKRLAKYMETPDFKPHSIRRTAITWMLNEKKIPMPIVRDAVGHSSLSVTNLYAQPSANDVIEAMKRLGTKQP